MQENIIILFEISNQYRNSNDYNGIMQSVDFVNYPYQQTYCKSGQ